MSNPIDLLNELKDGLYLPVINYTSVLIDDLSPMILYKCV